MSYQTSKTRSQTEDGVCGWPSPGWQNNLISGFTRGNKGLPYQQDAMGLDYELEYFRDTDGREVDFVVTERRVPKTIIECKWSDRDIDRSLRYLSKKFPKAEAWQISAVGKKDYISGEGIRVSPALNFLKNLI